jgi:hypothetical protein
MTTDVATAARRLARRFPEIADADIDPSDVAA